LEKLDNILLILNETECVYPDILEMSCWADDIRSNGLTAFSKWHYIDNPLIDNTDKKFVLEDASEDSNNIVYALKEATHTLSFSPHKKNASVDFGRSLMMRMLIHLMGDLHQPLHVSSRYNKEFPKGKIIRG